MAIWTIEQNISEHMDGVVKRLAGRPIDRRKTDRPTERTNGRTEGGTDERTNE